MHRSFLRFRSDKIKLRNMARYGKRRVSLFPWKYPCPITYWVLGI